MVGRDHHSRTPADRTGIIRLDGAMVSFNQENEPKPVDTTGGSFPLNGPNGLTTPREQKCSAPFRCKLWNINSHSREQTTRIIMPPALITYDAHTVYLHEGWTKTGRILATHFGSPHLASDLVQMGNLLRLGDTVAKCVPSPGGLLPPAGTVYTGLSQLPEHVQSIWETHHKYEPGIG